MSALRDEHNPVLARTGSVRDVARRVSWLVLAGALTVVGCGGAGPTTGDAGIKAVACMGGKTLDEVIVKMEFVVQMPSGVSRGFDIDNYTAMAGDGKTCGHASLTAPDGTPGIDNQLSDLIPTADAISNGALEPEIQAAINGGQLLVGVTMDNVDDPKNDSCVTLRFRHLTGTPALGTDMILNPSQTFNAATDVPVSTVQASIRDGVVTLAQPFDLALPVRILDAKFTMNVHNTHARIQFAADGSADGVIGGSVVGDELITNLLMYGIGDNLKKALPALVDSISDQAFDPSTGRCPQFSIAMGFATKPAFINNP